MTDKNKILDKIITKLEKHEVFAEAHCKHEIRIEAILETISEVEREMEKIIKSEYSRCGKSNAVTCWVILGNWLRTGKYFPRESILVAKE